MNENNLKRGDEGAHLKDEVRGTRNGPSRSAGWAVASVCIVALLVGGFLWWHFVESAKEVGRGVADRGEAYMDKGIQIAEKFTAAHITNTFRDRLTSVSSSSGSLLEVAVIEAEEHFFKSDTKRTFWGRLSAATVSGTANYLPGDK